MEVYVEPALLSVRDLTIHFPRSDHSVLRAVESVNFDVHRGEVVAIVGESGCGKSTTALSLLNLVPPPGQITEGVVRFGERSVLEMTKTELCRYRGRDVAFVFQNPNTYLNPVMRIVDQIAEVARLHFGLSKKESRENAIRALERVKVSEPERVANAFPHELSGGTNQRALIAMAIVCEPSLLILDEPTTALDVTIQREIINLLRDLRARLRSSMIFITHDLALVAELADRVYIMYGGRIVEEGPVDAIFHSPTHPYTRALLASVLKFGSTVDRLPTLEGHVPDLSKPVRGCGFFSRCPLALDRCTTEVPRHLIISPGHAAACWRTNS